MEPGAAGAAWHPAPYPHSTPAHHDHDRHQAEALAKAQFGRRKEPYDCALLYIALGRKALLLSLFRSVGWSAREEGSGGWPARRLRRSLRNWGVCTWRVLRKGVIAGSGA